MGARAQNPPVVEAWIASLGRCSKAEQYPGPVRRFLHERGSEDLRSVSEPELIQYAAAIGSEGVRKKTVSALESFFAYAARHGHVSHDPARFLWQAVHRAVQDRTLVHELARAGLPNQDAAELSWRDVAALTLGPPDAPPRKLELSPELHRQLSGELLRLLQGTTPDELDSVLDAHVISQGGM